MYTTQHPLYCGIDLHARAMDVCILNQAGEMLLHRHMQATPDVLLKAIAPYRPDLVIAVAGLLTWSWLADLCADEAIPVVLGHARSMTAMHGGKATHAQSDSHKIAVLLRGGLLPPASVYPAALRATRDLLRRRLHLAHPRGALLAHVHHTHSPYHLPALAQNLASPANRDGVAARCAAPAVHKRMEGDRSLVSHADALLRDGDLPIVQTAKHHDAHTLSLLQTVPGLGQMLSLVLLYAMHQLDRFPRVPELASSCRLITCAQEANGKRAGTSGSTIGHAPLTWAFAAAAVFCLRAHPEGQQFLSRLEKTHDQGQALTIFAHQ